MNFTRDETHLNPNGLHTAPSVGERRFLWLGKKHPKMSRSERELWAFRDQPASRRPEWNWGHDHSSR